MSTKKNEKTFNDLLLGYQTRLQGVANDLGDRLARLVSTTDADVLKLIVKELPRREKNIRAEIRRLERLIKKIEKTRAPGFELGRDLVFQTARDVAENASAQTVTEAEAARNEADFNVEKPRAKTVSKSALANIVDFQPIEGASIATWYSALQRKDLERIANVVTRAAVEGLTVSKIAREIRGSKESDYTDGILQTTRNGAVALARTVINGVSNNARIETIKENEDAIDGARFVGTLDGKTCPHCGALDGAVWGPDELDKIRRPPLHVSCRCCVVPHVVLKGPDGTVYEIGSRPAANADFDALAKEAYDEAARKKGSPRRWEDLSPSTRLKYYYQAQKDFEKRTGKPAYRQVSPSTTFAEYFERQDDAFKRSWLGPKRYEAYRNGAKFGDVAKPSATYRATLPELPQTPGNGPISPSNAPETPSTAPTSTGGENEPLAPWEGPDELARLREKKRVDPATLPTLDGSPKQVAWVRDRIRADQVDAFNAVDLPEYLKTRIGGATDDEEEARRLALVRAEIEKRGEAAVLAELEEAAQEIAAKMFEETSCRAWIDGRFGPGVLHRSTTEALRRVATTGSAKPPKPAFDLPPLDLPELKLSRLSGTPRQIEWAEDLRRRAVRDLTEERANETARDALRRYRDKESAFAEEFRSDLEAAIKAVGGDEAAELILGREIFLDARGYAESFDRARDWINLRVADKKTLLEAAEFHVAGNPQNVAAILRRYAADAKKTDQPEPRPTKNDAMSQSDETKPAPLVDRAALPELKGSDKQRAWAAEIREKTLDELETVDVSAVVRDQTESALKSFRKRTAHLPPEKRAGYDKSRKLGVASLGQVPSDICAKLEAAIAERGETAVFAELEAATREIAAELLTETDASRWIDRRDLRPAGYLRGKKIFERWAQNADAKANAPQSDAPRPVVEERREPLIKGDARFGDRDAFAKFLSESTKKERKEALGKELDFAYNTRQLSDDELFDALTQGKTADDLQRVGVYVGHDAFPVKNPKRPTPEEIAANRKREEDEHVRPLLAFWGRTLGPEGPREKNIVLPVDFKEREKFTGAPNSSAEYYQDGKIKYRLYYDAEGRLEYIDDYSHGNFENHGGPHRHVFFGHAHCFAIDIKEIR